VLFQNDLEEKLKSVEEELQQEHDRHLISLTDLERKHSQDREKIKRDYHDRLEADKAELLRLTNNQLEFTTRRTIMENEMMTAELGYQNKQTEKMVKINEGLEKENSDMKREMSLLHVAEEELVKKNYQFQKTIKMMNIKIKAQEMDSQDVQSLEDLNKQESGNQKDNSEKNVKALEEKLQALRHKHILSLREQDKFKKELEEARAETQRMHMLKDDAKDFLMTCLEDARKQFTVQTGESKEWTPDQPIPWSLQGLSAVGREALLEYLLARLGGTNFGETKKSIGGRSSRTGKHRGGDTQSMTSMMGGTMNSQIMDGTMLPPIQGRNSPSVEQDPVFGSWGAKVQLPNSRLQKQYH